MKTDDEIAAEIGPNGPNVRRFPGAKPATDDKPNDEQPKTTWRNRLDLRHASDLEGKKVKPREWVVDDWIPRGHITGVYGPDSAGKTTLVTQLCCAASVENGRWLGMPVRKSRPFGFFCEDDDDEIERKIYDASFLYGHRRADYRDFGYLGRFACENLLFVRGRRGMLNDSALCRSLPAGRRRASRPSGVRWHSRHLRAEHQRPGRSRLDDGPDAGDGQADPCQHAAARPSQQERQLRIHRLRRLGEQAAGQALPWCGQE